MTTNHENTTNLTSHGVSLVIGTAGHVWVAESVTPDNGFYTLTNARIIRRWGTDKGLNQLIDGPTKETVLDAPAPAVFLVSQALIAILPCREGKWAGKL